MFNEHRTKKTVHIMTILIVINFRGRFEDSLSTPTNESHINRKRIFVKNIFKKKGYYNFVIPYNDVFK